MGARYVIRCANGHAIPRYLDEPCPRCESEACAGCGAPPSEPHPATCEVWGDKRDRSFEDA